MAIYLIDGKIGAGKTYYAVYYILKKYFQHDEVLDDYLPKKDLVLISNIDTLRLDHISLQHYIDEHGLEYVFSEQFISELRGLKKSPVIFLIDEAQKYFPRKFYNEPVFHFFQYSRHYGVDIFLITQDVDSLPKELRTLPEYTIHAVSRTHGTKLAFLYKHISNDEVVKTFPVKTDKRIFRLYRSFNFDEAEKPKTVIGRYLVMISICFAVAIFLFYSLFLGFFRAPVVAQTTSDPVSQVQPQVHTFADTKSTTVSSTTDTDVVYFGGKRFVLEGKNADQNQNKPFFDSKPFFDPDKNYYDSYIWVSQNCNLFQSAYVQRQAGKHEYEVWDCGKWHVHYENRKYSRKARAEVGTPVETTESQLGKIDPPSL